METTSIVITALLAVIALLLHRITLILRKVHEEVKLNTTIVQFLNERFKNRSSENMNTLQYRETIEKRLDWLSGSLHRTAEATENLVKIDQKLSAIESLCLINQLLNQLPERQQQVFIWSQLEGLTQQEIATRLNISTRTVMRDLVAVLTQCLAVMD
jgi:RNA polymerase sigma factor (sigma-70 family)